MTRTGSLVRGIGFTGLCALVLNGMIGAGIFALPFVLASRVGTWAPWLILAIGVAMLPLVLVFARLGSLYDVSGGPVVFVGDAFGPRAGFTIGWIQVLSVVASTAANANALAGYIEGSGAGPLLHGMVTLGVLLFAIGVCLLPSRRNAQVLELASVGKLLPLGGLALLALPVALHGLPAIGPPAMSAITEGTMLAAYAMIGFEGALTLAGDARDPRRHMPPALLAMFVFTGLFYALILLAYVAVAFRPGVTDPAPLGTLAAALVGPAGGVVLLVAAVFSIMGNLIMTTLGNSRRLLALGERDALPAWFAEIRPGSGVPVNAVLFIGAVAIGLALSGGFVILALLSVAARLVVYLACIAALPQLRRQRGEAISRGETILIAFAGALCLALASRSGAGTWLAMAAAIAAGLLVRSLARPATAPA